VRVGVRVGMDSNSAGVKIEVAIPVSCMEGVGGRTPGIAGDVCGRSFANL